MEKLKANFRGVLGLLLTIISFLFLIPFMILSRWFMWANMVVKNYAYLFLVLEIWVFYGNEISLVFLLKMLYKHDEQAAEVLEQYHDRLVKDGISKF